MELFSPGPFLNDRQHSCDRLMVHTSTRGLESTQTEVERVSQEYGGGEASQPRTLLSHHLNDRIGFTT